MDIDLFQPSDADALSPLLEEMQRYYSVFCPPRETIIDTLRNLSPGAEILVARLDGLIVGFAGFGANFAGPDLRPGFFLKDFYVTEAARGQRVGRGLMAKIAAIAVERGFTRIDWTASRSDQNLIRFYNTLGGALKEDRVFFRLDGENLQILAKTAEPMPA